MTPATSTGSAVAVLVLSSLVATRAVVSRRRTRRVALRLGDPRTARDATTTLRPPVEVTAPARLATALDHAGIDVRADAVASWGVVAGVGLVMVGVVAGGVALAVLLPVLAGVGAAGALAALRGRGDRRYATALPLALELVARSLRTGASLHQAIDEAGRGTPGPAGGDLTTIAGECRLGQPLVVAVDAWADRRPLPSVRLAAAALCLGAETGGAQARAVDSVAATLRERAALRGEVRALTSQARTSALVIALAPIGFCTMTVLVDARSATFLLRTPLGLALLVTGFVLDAVSAAWMHRLTARVAT